jgi:hypothetical protein
MGFCCYRGGGGLPRGHPLRGIPAREMMTMNAHPAWLASQLAARDLCRCGAPAGTADPRAPVVLGLLGGGPR